MKVRFADGTECAVDKTSSKFCLVINSVDQETIDAFAAHLTAENLDSFQIIDDAGNVTDKAERYVRDNSDMALDMMPDRGVRTKTMFLLRPMTETEKELARLRNELEIRDQAIMELATLIG